MHSVLNLIYLQINLSKVQYGIYGRQNLLQILFSHILVVQVQRDTICNTENNWGCWNLDAGFISFMKVLFFVCSQRITL